MATKYYGIKDNWTDDDVANVIEVASEDGSVSSVKVNGVEYGGGGGGDFSTAQVTVINNLSSDQGYVTTETPYVHEEDGDEWLEGVISVNDGETKEAKIVVYKGVAYADFAHKPLPAAMTITATGNISVDDGLCTITGDGTITIS